MSNSVAALAKGYSETAFVPEASSPFPLYSSRVLAARQVPWLPVQMAGDGALPPPVPGSAGNQASAGPSSPDWEAGSDTQCCLMIHSNSLCIPLGTQKGAREQISTLQTHFPVHKLTLPSEPMSLLKGSTGKPVGINTSQDYCCEVQSKDLAYTSNSCQSQ